MMRFAAIKKYEDGGEMIMEWFGSSAECLRWIARQQQPTTDSEWRWYVGEF